MTHPLASMTGYARAGGAALGCRFQIEIKSVNSRGLDVRMRLAPGLDALEPELRRRIGDTLARGAVSLSISLQRDGAGREVVINQQALGAVLDALDALAGRVEADRPRLDGVLALQGVLETRETSMTAEAEENLHAMILEQVDICLDDLVASRRTEGDRLTNVLISRIEEIEALTKQAEEHPSRSREAILARLREQVADLDVAGSGLSEERLHQEAMLLATKADIREELDRLTAHIKSARQLIANGGPVGRKLDFLSQEFNREANTLCSKSNAVDLTAIGLDLKAVIDQLREQVQNIE
ncbi:YicC/YloC family endoribonuclease [Mariluticola halotolerans]|uniref:YicC/YloC family endoribonuclease n=1 Tax=Mariluticola halotolerans TaxID=2909283 RepID=UPI0026E300A8|nr:YicC/YloC family endoribonuclease [Mariluticola halotolerans]UJQ95166.1 YicC family protein [Mariluticola halotolerans]